MMRAGVSFCLLRDCAGVGGRRAFSLVELSIVLVILGLLVGGVLSGQSLIRSSELRSITTEYQRYATTMGTFRDKYFALPGDMSNASSFWSSLGNGNGDGMIKNTATANTNEISLFWLHLVSATMVEGSFTNVANTTMTPGTNNPKSKVSSGAWNIIYLATVGVDSSATDAGATDPGGTTFYAKTYGHALLFGSGTNALLPGVILKPEEAWNIDTKLDDGKPDTGSIATLESQGSTTAGSGCGNLAASTSAIAASSYDLTATSQTCALVMNTGF